MPFDPTKYSKKEETFDPARYSVAPQVPDTVVPKPQRSSILESMGLPDPNEVVPFAGEPQQPREAKHPLQPLFDLMGFVKEKADIRIPGTETEVLGHEFPGETRRRLFEPIPNPESDPVISITNALKGFLGLTPDIPEFLLKDLPEAVAGTLTPEGQLDPEAPTLGRVGKEMGRSTIDVMALAAMRQLHPEEYKRFIKTDRGKAIKEMEAERLHEPALLPLILSGGFGKAAKLTGKLGKSKPTGILSDVIPKERVPTERAPIVEEILGVEKAKAPAEQPKAPLPKPVGETAESILAIRTEADAIAKKLTDDFGELPQYKTMNMGDQARQAQDIIAKDYNQAKRMAMGQELPPEGLREASIYEAVKLRALKEGDVQTLMELATESEIPTKLSEYGQAIKAADSQIMNDPVKVMQDVSNTRSERSKRIGRKSTNAEVERLRGELETLQKAFDERIAKVTKRTPVKYGSKNKIVNQATYEKARLEIIRAMNTLTANPILNPELVANAAKVGAYHLEAGTRLFADWSDRMVNDLGDWVKPHLKDIWEQAKEDKKLRTALKAQKTRLINEAETFTDKLETLDFTKQEKRKLFLDKEARKLKRARDRAKENYNAALNASNSVSRAEAQKIVELSKLTEEARIAMEKGGNRYDYGAARVAYENYVNELKGDKAKLKAQLRERGQEFKTTFKEHKTKAVFDVGKDALKVIRDNSVAIVASWDNSFMGRQGLKTLMTHPTIWAKGAGKSFTDFAKTLGGKKTHDALMADIYSRENYLNESYQKAKILTRAEEEYPTSLPERIPALGRVFKASENAFVGSAIRMRTGLFDLLNERARANGIDVSSKAHLEPLGKMINSLTARGQWGKTGEPAIVRVFLWAPKMIKGNLDVLTAHGAGVGLKSKFARRQAAINLTKIVAETATVLAIADALHPGSVEWDPRSTRFGRITIGDTTYDITGGAGSYVVLAARLLTNERKNLSGKVKEFGAGFGQPTRFDALSNFLTNKLTPPVGVVADWLRDRDFKGDPFVIEEALAGAATPITVQQAVELKDNASADRVAGVILDAIGVGSFSIDEKVKKRKKSRSSLSKLKE